MGDEKSGKLKYINGIPYFTGRHVQLDAPPASRSERLVGGWQRMFGPRLGGPLLILALVAGVVVVGGLIDYALLSLLAGPD